MSRTTLTFFARGLMLRDMGASIQILSLCLVSIFASAVNTQSAHTCGVVGIDGPSEVDSASPLILKAKVTGLLHTTKPEFKWFLSLGTIKAGEGTDKITVDTSGLAGLTVTVTVQLVGARDNCSETASLTFQVNNPPIACGLAFDQYGDINFKDEKARLDNFAIQLINAPQSSGSIMMSAGAETFKGETTERLSRAKSYLINVRDIDPNRIVTTDCGFTQTLTLILHVVPLGASFPQCTFEELPFSKVRFTKRRPPAPKKRR